VHEIYNKAEEATQARQKRSNEIINSYKRSIFLLALATRQIKAGLHNKDKNLKKQSIYKCNLDQALKAEVQLTFSISLSDISYLMVFVKSRNTDQVYWSITS
jgi:hypothetical protein